MLDTTHQSQIWIVVGHTGEYESKKTWLVAAYASRDTAELHTRRANEALRELGLLRSRKGESVEVDYWDRQEVGKTFAWDSNIRVDYTGTMYTYEWIWQFLHPDLYLDFMQDFRT